MKITNISKYLYLAIIFLLLNSCKTKTFVNEKFNSQNDGTRQIESELKKNMLEKKTGIFIYPKLGTKISLKQGQLNGIFEIIDGKDTLYYCNFINNKPIGMYMKNFNYQYINRHYRTLPLTPNIDFGDGVGFFNNQNQKEGAWTEYNGNCTEKGSYKNGKKEGLWNSECFDDSTRKYDKKKILYHDDNIKE